MSRISILQHSTARFHSPQINIFKFTIPMAPPNSRQSSARHNGKSNKRKGASPKTNIEEFKRLMKNSNRILALCGAGLSASSGLPTFRGAGGLWRNHQSTSLATPEAFKADPALVWLFYAWRRHMALKAKPNPAHYALAELAKVKENFLCLTQNVDGTYIFQPRNETKWSHE
jgi:hypothetical protein